jgi:uncharacterized protein
MEVTNGKARLVPHRQRAMLGRCHRPHGHGALSQEPTMNRIAARLFMIVALVLASASGWAQQQVVYHIDHAGTQGLKGLRNLRNHLDVDPAARITVVTHAEGVDFLLEGAKAANGTDYAPLVAALRARGVNFEVCEITLKNRELKKEQFVQEANFTPSGVVRLAKLQAQGAAYIKP